MRFYDAHNHLQDPRFAGTQSRLMAACQIEGIAGMVVNGSCEADWPEVARLAARYTEVRPSFGYHPWYVHERTAHWQDTLRRYLDTLPAAVGEVGLDRWKPGLAYEGQEAVFLDQLLLAAERNRPLSIHCLRTWGRLLELLETHPRPARGFLLHSYGGPAELVPPLAALGAYFGFPGYFAHPGKERRRDAFRSVPLDRWLIETDAPDQRLPDHLQRHPCATSDGSAPINHPANLPAVYTVAANLLGLPLAQLAAIIEENFLRLFGLPTNQPTTASPATVKE